MPVLAQEALRQVARHARAAHEPEAVVGHEPLVFADVRRDNRAQPQLHGERLDAVEAHRDGPTELEEGTEALRLAPMLAALVFIPLLKIRKHQLSEVHRKTMLCQ